MPEISRRLRERCESTVAGRSWLGRLPEVLRDLSSRWSLSLAAPFNGEDTSSAWVAPALRADGSEAVLKVAFPHFEGEHEIDGLRFWSGNPTVQLLAADENLGAMLLERCVPGATLRTVPEAAQDAVVAGLPRPLWRAPPPAHSSRQTCTPGTCFELSANPGSSSIQSFRRRSELRRNATPAQLPSAVDV